VQKGRIVRAPTIQLDDISVWHDLRGSENLHARALVHRERYSLAYETREHLSSRDSASFAALLPRLRQRFGAGLMIDHSAKDPHRLAKSGVLVQSFDGSMESMHEASNFIRHLSRIDSFRMYAASERCAEVRSAVLDLLASG